MEAGRELDALVAEKVFGHAVEWRWCWLSYESGVWHEWQTLWENDSKYLKKQPDVETETGRRQPCYQDDTMWFAVLPYSTDIAAAWQVVEKLSEQWHPHVQHLGIENHIWRVVLFNGKTDAIVGIADTVPLAICLAALAAVGESNS